MGNVVEEGSNKLYTTVKCIRGYASAEFTLDIPVGF